MRADACLPLESDTLGDDPRVTTATQAPRDGDRAAASDAVLRRSSRLWVPWLAGVAERVEVDLAVSGLKPDWPPSAAIGGIAPAGAVRTIVPLQQQSG